MGILGGGQLGRMMALAARSLGYGVQVMDPDPHCPAKGVADVCHTAPFSDVAAARALAQACGAVTLEIEKIPRTTLEAVAQLVPLRPGVEVLACIQHRGRQKAWLAEHGFPLGPWRAADSEEALGQALSSLKGRCFVKASEGGYDGRGQVLAEAGADASFLWSELGQRPVVVEAALTLNAELSVLVARNPSGEVAVYPPAFNHHENRILAWSQLPAPVSPTLQEEAMTLARSVAEARQMEGLLVVELFLLQDGSLRINELAPRPHNSYHATEHVLGVSQFEQAVRAACNLPLGATSARPPAAMANILGDLWKEGRAPAFEKVLALPFVHLHLYGKQEARVGRKMGHLVATGDSPEEALKRVQEAHAQLKA